MQASFIKKYFSKSPDTEEVIAFFWSKEDALANALDYEDTRTLTDAEWAQVVKSIEDGYYHGILVDYISNFINEILEEKKGE